MKGRFYAHGKFFDDEQKFWKFCHEWPDMPFDLDEFKHQMELRVHEAQMNKEIRDGKLTNKQAYQILRLSTDWAVNGWRIEEKK